MSFIFLIHQNLGRLRRAVRSEGFSPEHKGYRAMTTPQKTLSTLELGTADGLGILPVTVAEFTRFDESFSEKTDALVARWKHLAAPNSQRPKQSRSTREKSS